MKLFLFFFIFIPAASFAQPGFLDPGFGDSGKIFLSGTNYNYCGAVQPDDKILVGGEFYVARFLPNGAIDKSFGIKGRANMYQASIPSGIRVLANGEIITAGTAFEDIAASKFKANGTPDSSFGKNGFVRLDFGQLESISAMQIQHDGKIILAGSTRRSHSDFLYNMMMVRLNTNGSLDESFGNNGKVLNSSGIGITCLALQPDGKMITGGVLWPIGQGLRNEFVVCRYDTNGKLDNSFGTNGAVFTDITNNNDYPLAVSILEDGKILMAGNANEGRAGQKSNMAIVKYNSDGLPDENFGVGGVSNIIFEGVSSGTTGLLAQEDGKILLTGTTYPDDGGGHGNFALARLQANGSLDSSFGINGKQITDFGESEVSHASIFQTNGKIVLIGDSYFYTGDRNTTILARYNNDAAMPLRVTYLNATP